MAGDSEQQDQWTMSHFSQANPKGPEQDDVGALLERVAESIRSLGRGLRVADVTFHNETDDEGNSWPTMTVYYSREDPTNSA